MREFRNYASYLFGKPEFLFVHIPKNGGMSLRLTGELHGRLIEGERLFLKDLAYVRELKSIMKSNGFHHGIQHARLRDYRPSVVARLQPVAIIRNPWSRVVSRFTFDKKILESKGGDVSQSFEQFLEERFVWGNRPFFWHRAIKGWYPAADYVVDENGKLGCDILRTEHLSTEAQSYFGLSAAVGQRNRSGSGEGDYRSFYTPQTIQIVADWYKADIDMFGFDFDTPARRNYFYETRDPTETGRPRGR
jgi:hypothetical protein